LKRSFIPQEKSIAILSLPAAINPSIWSIRYALAAQFSTLAIGPKQPTEVVFQKTIKYQITKKANTDTGNRIIIFFLSLSFQHFEGKSLTLIPKPKDLVRSRFSCTLSVFCLSANT